MSSITVTNGSPSAIQNMREEITDDAVYMVGLKKISYPIAASAEESNCNTKNPTEACIKKTQQIYYTIRAGTLDKLIDSFVQEKIDMVDSSYLNIFLLTYRTFTDPLTLLNTLEKRFKTILGNSSLKDSYKLTYTIAVKTFLNLWLEEQYLDDFNIPPKYTALELMLSMVHSWHERARRTEIRESLDSLRNRIIGVLERFHREHALANNLYREVSIDVSGCSEPEDTNNRSLDRTTNATCNSRRIIDFSQLEVVTIAQQLTLIDKDLFLRVIPHHFLARARGSSARSVDATIRQFNLVVNAVVSTILTPQGIKFSQRAVIIFRWIEVAAELRALKNFSTLTAVISGLQSHEIHRLHHCWKHLEKKEPSHWQLFMELSKISSAENNQEFGREILRKEGTAKFPEVDKKQAIKQKFGSSIFRKFSFNSNKNMRGASVVGTIPFMGTFLTDLTMIDNAHNDLSKNNLINFDKRRKEFDVLASISMYQSAAKNYHYEIDGLFAIWFESVEYMDAAARERRSLEVEPNRICPRRNSSECSNPSHSPSPAVEGISNSSGNAATGSSCSGLEDSVSLCSSHSSVGNEGVPLRSALGLHRQIMSVSSLASLTQQNCQIIKMRLNIRHPSAVEENSGVNYKSIMVNNTEKVNTVIVNSLDKFGLDDSPDHYCVVQIFTDGKELLIPDKSNVYYALGAGSHEGDIICEIRMKTKPSSTTARQCASMKTRPGQHGDDNKTKHVRQMSVT